MIEIWILILLNKNHLYLMFKTKNRHFLILLNQQLELEQLHFHLQLIKQDGQVLLQQQFQYSFAPQSIFIYIYDLIHSQLKWQIITQTENYFLEMQFNQL
ncbi:unnamed protein product [Paramecium sonneborni]|uniref:Uncharacterized protein n=1 Tax=Paramecium sonneborni TaxID=65129 RepID=A0A8S1QLF2_9CILI|nr:unnamed protein product [Paramecium sonneborni]